jgi:co-chaperonin GroES (HSP10)
MNERTEEILNKTGLNWNVVEEEITTKSGIIIPEHKAIVREDNSAILGIHGKGYTPYQNSQMAELLDKVSQQIGLPIHKGGSFGQGEKVYIQLKSNDMNLGNDRIEGFITGINSFDGSTSLAFGPSNITISCMNSFFSSYRNVQSKVRHTINMDYRIDEICKGLELVLDEESKIFETIKKLSEAPTTNSINNWVAHTLFNIAKDVDIKDDEQISTVTKNRLITFEKDLKAEFDSKGGASLWSLFSGTTRYSNYSTNKNPLQVQQDLMFGVSGQRKRIIFKHLAELVQ